MLIDSHCHLEFPELAADRAGVLARARAAGVGHLVTISTRVRRFAELTAIAEAHDAISCTLGTHPHHAAEEPDVTEADLTRLAAHPACIGIGETGLDFHYDRSPRDLQEAQFRTHCRAAVALDLPVIIHTRDADDDTWRVLADEHARSGGRLQGLLHCFSSGRDLALRCVERLGFLVSFSGILTYKTADALRAVAAELPRDHLLVETDAPYLAPVPRRGKPNEPAFVVHTAQRLAELQGLTADALAALTTANFRRLFTKAPLAG